MIRNIHLVVVSFLLVVGLTACSTRETPSEVAENFLNALIQKDYAMAKKYACKDAQMALSMMEKNASNSPSQKLPVKVEILHEERMDGEAFVHHKLGFQQEKLKLVEEDGEWKAVVVKE